MLPGAGSLSQGKRLYQRFPESSFLGSGGGDTVAFSVEEECRCQLLGISAVHSAISGLAGQPAPRSPPQPQQTPRPLPAPLSHLVSLGLRSPCLKGCELGSSCNTLELYSWKEPLWECSLLKIKESTPVKRIHASLKTSEQAFRSRRGTQR